MKLKPHWNIDPFYALTNDDIRNALHDIDYIDLMKIAMENLNPTEDDECPGCASFTPHHDDDCVILDIVKKCLEKSGVSYTISRVNE